MDLDPLEHSAVLIEPVDRVTRPVRRPEHDPVPGATVRVATLPPPAAAPPAAPLAARPKLAPQEAGREPGPHQAEPEARPHQSATIDSP